MIAPVQHRTSVGKAARDMDPRPWLASCACGWSSRHWKREWARVYAARHHEETR